MEKILMGRPLMENPLCPFILLPSLPVPYSPYSAVILLAESPLARNYCRPLGRGEKWGVECGGAGKGWIARLEKIDENRGK